MKVRELVFILCFSLILIPAAISLAQQNSDQTEQRRETKIEDTVYQASLQPQTVKDLIEYLKQRAALNLKAKKKEQLLKTKLYASASYGFDTNVTQDSNTKGDYFFEEYLNFSWQPTFNKFLGLKTGYWALNDNYLEQTDFNFLDHAVNFSLVVTPFESGRVRLEPGLEHEWLWCSRSSESDYHNTKLFFRFRQYMGKRWDWNYGINYEYADKIFESKKANDPNFNPTQSSRQDTRNTIDTYLTKYWQKFNFTLRMRSYINYSNEQYLEYYDYCSYRPSITIGRTFLKDDKLYIAFNPSFERKNYMSRPATDTKRFDNITTWLVSVYYTFKKPCTLTYEFTYRKLGSNDNTARYKGIINMVGMSIDF